MNTNDELNILLNTALDDLYIEFGKELQGEALFETTDSEFKKQAKDWLAKQKKELQQLICTNSKIQGLHKTLESKESKINLVTAIADLISGLLINISPWTLSVIILKQGLDSFCDE